MRGIPVLHFINPPQRSFSHLLFTLSMALFNPFARRDTHSASSLNTYRVLVPLSWALVVIVGLYYSIHSPDDTKKSKKIWKQANKHNTPFSQNTTVTGVYW